MDKDIENYLKDKNILNIMNKVSFPYKNNIDHDEIDSIKMDILWDCINKYDPTRGSKFTSYLYQQLSFAFRSKVKKKKKVLLMQLLNPHFGAKVKVYHDPFANSTASVGVGGFTVAGGDEKSYYVQFGEDTAFKLEKKHTLK